MSNKTKQIPKILHYCWFGNNPFPEVITKCIESWKKFCPDYEIKEWNESNCSLMDNEFIREAYENKKWAFVSDVVRLTVLYEYGGFYLDTDVEILAESPFEQYRDYENVLVFDSDNRISTGLFFGSRKRAPLLKSLMSPYETMHFKGDRSQINSNVNLPIFVEHFPLLKWSNSTQIINNTYFLCSGEYNKKMHHYGTRTWLDDKVNYKPVKYTKLKQAIRSARILNFLIKTKLGRKILPLYEFLFYDLLDMGPLYFVKLIFTKLKRKFKSKKSRNP